MLLHGDQQPEKTGWTSTGHNPSAGWAHNLGKVGCVVWCCTDPFLRATLSQTMFIEWRVSPEWFQVHFSFCAPDCKQSLEVGGPFQLPQNQNGTTRHRRSVPRPLVPLVGSKHVPPSMGQSPDHAAAPRLRNDSRVVTKNREETGETKKNINSKSARRRTGMKAPFCLILKSALRRGCMVSCATACPPRMFNCHASCPFHTRPHPLGVLQLLFGAYGHLEWPASLLVLLQKLAGSRSPLKGLQGEVPSHSQP